MKRTIFITSCHPLISRNILSTGILELLVSNDIQIVILVPNGKGDFFKGSFENNNIFVREVKLKTSKRESLLRYLSLASLNTDTLNIKRKTEMNNSGFYTNFFLSNKLAHYLIRKLEKITYRKNIFKDLFKEFSPSLVFVTDIQNEIDLSLLNEAKRNKIKTIGMVRSWDNLTSKGLIRIIPESLIVWNDIIKNEAITFHNIKESIILKIGIPHYDLYKKYDYSDRELFYKKIGADLDKKIILFIPIGDRYLRNNKVDKDMVDILSKNIPNNYQIIVRLPPGDYVRELENSYNQFGSVKIIYDRATQTHENIKMTEITKNDDIHLAKTIFWSDIVVSGPSTLIIDSVYMDKPTILFAFDGYDNRDYLDSIRRYYDYNNFVPIIESGGVRVAKTINQFIDYVKGYIENNNKDSDSRKELVSKEVYIDDGKSTERLLNVILTELNK